ncbi:jg8573 [Pararge aegeria aegeria]|uniref:Jg8573 protein n=1 Tax=Pararge aegeria aegeria TaxID=348720 RepID=A0A8S4RL61_9NEOP|nr:jg8573 [Pararge aegeria aegeria]
MLYSTSRIEESISRHIHLEITVKWRSEKAAVKRPAVVSCHRAGEDKRRGTSGGRRIGKQALALAEAPAAAVPEIRNPHLTGSPGPPRKAGATRACKRPPPRMIPLCLRNNTFERREYIV